MKKLFSEIPCLKGERVTLRRLIADDEQGLRELTENKEVYRYLPTFLYEQQYEDKSYVIAHLYDECFPSSLILGVYLDDAFCGLAEIYGYSALLSKVSVGYRLLERYWGQGIATETLKIMVRYLLNETDVKYITASTMVKNEASSKVLMKNGFKLVDYTVFENWGYAKPILTKKWLKTAADHHLPYRFRS